MPSLKPSLEKAPQRRPCKCIPRCACLLDVSSHKGYSARRGLKSPSSTAPPVIGIRPRKVANAKSWFPARCFTSCLGCLSLREDKKLNTPDVSGPRSHRSPRKMTVDVSNLSVPSSSFSSPQSDVSLSRWPWTSPMRIVDRPVVVDCMAVTRPLPALCAGGKIPRPLLGDVPRVGERSMGGARKPVQQCQPQKCLFRILRLSLSQ